MILYAPSVPAMDVLLPYSILRFSTPPALYTRRLPALARRLRCITTTAAAQPEEQLPPNHDLPLRRPPASRPPTASIPKSSIRSSQLPITAKPFSAFLTDTFSRQHTYLRISITERCNLRCTYCMPAAGVPLSPPSHLLTTPEIVYLSELFVSQGVTKIRLTGGEPTIRKDIVPLMQQIGGLRKQGLKELCLTSNGIVLGRKLEKMVEAGLTGVNLSLDTLDPFQFQLLTRRSGFEAVMACMQRILEMNKRGAGVKLKVNVVVMRGVNDGEMMLKFVELARDKDIEVRFIEYMPFEGNKWERRKVVGYREMLELIRQKYPGIDKVWDAGSETSKTYQVPGFAGRVGFITSMTDDFCGGCNRLRITSDGNLKVCLFGNTEVSLRDLMREGSGGEPISEEAMEALKKTEMDARQSLIQGAAGGIDGYAEREQRLLETIGMAVKRKKAKHAGMGKLENMKNRPMILIGGKTLPAKVVKLNHPRRTPSRLPFENFSPPRIVSIPSHLLHPIASGLQPRLFSTSSQSRTDSNPPPHLPHLTQHSTIHQTSITSKPSTHRTALAIGHIRFSSPLTLPAISAHLLKKGDVLAVARVGAISAMKETGRLVVLCHSGIGIEGAEVKVEAVDGWMDHRINATKRQGDEAEEMMEIGAEKEPGEYQAQNPEEAKIERAMMLNEPIGDYGGVRISVKVETTAKTGIEMEALTGVMGAALNVVDMVKGIDKAVSIEEVKVVGKKGGRSGGWGVWDGEGVYGR